MMMATTTVVAFIVFSCSSRIGEADRLDLNSHPVQIVNDMFAVQTKNGVVVMRMEADVMERYSTDSMNYETFPRGLAVYGYTDEGLLETTIFSDNAVHETMKRSDQEEIWKAYGNVVIKNVIKQETMETDTLYWDKANEELYTDCYIRMYSPDGFMQGYGMRSNQKASNSVILRPFNSFGVVVQDTTAVLIDSVNFIGPFLKK
ncbi:MAG: LPS export ABC transporter periplasmic protein LptC [Bacteroidales bacterium]|nr:LPS export ABC transporter periplasmic protein LptC [Bacteroidales bacterium]